jgi:hypothetical protein
MTRSPSRRLIVAALGFALLAAGCGGGGGAKAPASTAGGSVEPTTMPPSAVPEAPTSSTMALRADALVLRADGIGPLAFGTQAAVAMGRLTQALGQAEKVTPVSAAGVCGATRIFTWKNFAVLINEVSARTGGNPGLVGWWLGEPASGALTMKTDKGISVGSTVGAVKAAYGSAVTVANASPATLQIAGANGAITGELEGRGDAAKVRALQAGTVCGM